MLQIEAESGTKVTVYLIMASCRRTRMVGFFNM